MNYRIVCQFLPDVAVFGGRPGHPRKGAWRVLSCADQTGWHPLRPIHVIDTGTEGKLLLIHSHRPRQPNTWVNPYKVVREWLTLGLGQYYQRQREGFGLSAVGAPEDYVPIWRPEPLVLGRGG